ncbi:TPA: GNAT family N-acetyltransferase [Candidatus Poribacteria bacterium]|nr:GNAT family N-acetyltransferase [Candidatus Poribacteria bacterium]
MKKEMDNIRDPDSTGEDLRQISKSRNLVEQSQNESFRSKESLFIGRISPVTERESSQRLEPPQLKINVRECQDHDQDFIDQLRQEHLLASAPKSRLTDLSRDEIVARMENWYSEKIQLLQDVPVCRTYIATDENDQPLGYAIVVAEAKDDFRSERQGFLCDLAVGEQYWVKGVAQALIKACEDYIKRMGHQFMMLNVSAFNDRAIEFYEKLGYVEEWRMMGKRLD